MYAMILRTIILLSVTVFAVSYQSREKRYVLANELSGYSYPTNTLLTRNNVGSYCLCAKYCFLDNATAFSFHNNNKICVTHTRKVCSTNGGVNSTGMMVYNPEEDKSITPTSCDNACGGVVSLDLCGKAIPSNCFEDDGPMGITPGKSWTVIQRRIDGTLNFNKNWAAYKNGFGDPNGNYWLGNDAIYCLTRNMDTELRIDIVDKNGNTFYAIYTTFYILDESNKYRLTVSGYSGTAGDSLRHHNTAFFSASDRDNDGNPTTHCAQMVKGGWWYRETKTPVRYCLESSLNAQWDVYVWWFGMGFDSQKKTTMMVRSKN